MSVPAKPVVSPLRPAATDPVAPEALARDAGTPAAVSPPLAATQPAVTPRKSRLRGLILPILVLAGLGAGAWYGHDWWTNGRFLVSTDDAYIEGDIATISPKVTGYVASVNVVANQQVKAGDALVTLDDGDYRLAREQADAQIATATLSLSRYDAQIEGARASLQQATAQKTAAEAALRGATTVEKRASDLSSRDVGTVASLDNAKVALDQAQANLLGSDANIAAAKANIAVLQAQRAEAESAVKSLTLARDKAVRDLGFTVLKAPYDGVIGNLSVQTGDLVSAGQRLAALVPIRELYIEANFKETQVAHVAPGSKVAITIDALEGETLEGTVASIAPASGSVFSLLPAENATGNFTKIIQRIPVRIALPPAALADGRLRAGLSVIVDVDTRTAPANEATAALAK